MSVSETSTPKRTIAYLAPEITALSATFVYKEIIALEKRDFNVIPFSVHNHTDEVADVLQHLHQRVRTVYGKNTIGFSLVLLKELVLSPKKLFGSCKYLLADLKAVSGATQKLKLSYQFLAGIWLSKKLADSGVTHLHIHFGHVPTQIGMYAALHENIPFSFMVHANDLFQRPLLYQEKGERAAAVTTISVYNVKELVKQGVPKEKIHIVRCGINPEEFVFLPKENIQEPFRVCVIARLVHKKGIDTLIEAIGRLKQNNQSVALEIAGTGPESEQLKALVSELALENEVKFVGRIENHLVSNWLAEQDLFVLPARVDRNGDMDGIPVVLMEAMSQGIPVISTNISGIPELVIDGKTGIIVSPEDEAAVAASIHKICTDEESRKMLIENARKFVTDEFSVEVNTKRLMSVFRDNDLISGAK